MNICKGPWRATKQGGSVWFGGLQIAHVSNVGDERAAVANLLAAAPELRDACEAAYEFIFKEHAMKLWNEHFSMDSDKAKQHAKEHPLEIEIILLDVLSALKKV